MRRWLEGLETHDPALHADLTRKLRARQKAAAERPPEIILEGAMAPLVAAPLPPPPLDLVFETIVREGRPALFVRDNAVSFAEGADQASAVIVDRLKAHEAILAPVIPLVGRIDVKNHARGFPFVGTGWLIEDDIVVTNRHVGLLLASQGADGFRFLPGRLGDPMAVSVDYRHEDGVAASQSVAVERVIWIEMAPKGPDIAFLKVARRTDGTKQNRIELAASDPEVGLDVAVVGYPARAPPDIIPDQAWMERIFGTSYDVKRIAPGQTTQPSDGWTTHDCTTLGGNSGSVVLDMATGKALALHFAGLYLVTNYAVPASTIARYSRDRPWEHALSSSRRESQEAEPQPAASFAIAQAGGSASVTLNVPITITVSIGEPGAGSAGGASSATGGVESAARDLARVLRGSGVLAVREGLWVESGALVDKPCIVVAADPDRLDQVRGAAPTAYMGFPVQVRPASIDDQLGGAHALEAPAGIAYDDDKRTGPEFGLGWFDEPMKLRCHVGPERGLEELDRFLKQTQSELVSSMYQFYTEAVRRLVDRELTGSKKPHMTLVLDPQTRDHGQPKAGEFERKATFDKWAKSRRFENIYVPEGSGGLVDKAYHIKVTVKDRQAVWLSSGNWTHASQPEIPAGGRNDPNVTSRAGNREWHVVAEHAGLAERFRAHILQDYRRCGELGGTLEASPESLILVDVPILALESLALEAPATRVFEPLAVDRKVKVRPILTPDRQGRIYCDAVLELIRSAKRQLLFQNQYINVTKVSPAQFGELVDALSKASRTVPDVRIILRSDGTGFWDNIAELKRRGIDVATKVRRLANTHTKGIVVDGERVIVGSQNWSASAVMVNRDASLLFDDAEIAAYYAGVFEEDWARASVLTQPPPAAPHTGARLATGEAVPAGFVRMTLAEYQGG
jgi:V8-like Glu-specific endopeptidase